MSTVFSKQGTPIVIHPHRSFWAAKLSDGEWVCELDQIVDIRRGTHRDYDWVADLVGSGDVRRVTEVWLFCPPSEWSPRGNTARLPVPVPGRAFSFHNKSIDVTLGGEVISSRIEFQIIGVVTNDINQACTCFIWDNALKMMIAEYKTRLNNFGDWRTAFREAHPLYPYPVPQLPPIRQISHEAMGLELG